MTTSGEHCCLERDPRNARFGKVSGAASVVWMGSVIGGGELSAMGPKSGAAAVTVLLTVYLIRGVCVCLGLNPTYKLDQKNKTVGTSRGDFNRTNREA